MTIDFKDELSEELKGSFLKFTRFFYKILTSRDFIVSEPVGRESHHITIARALTQAARLELPTHRLLINTAPGSGKSTLLTMFVAWTMAQYPDSKYIYVSYSKTLADKMTEQIKRIMSLREYEYLFDVHLRKDSKAKDYFQTSEGGAVASAGSAGTITGLDAGLAGLERWGGCLICFPHHELVHTENGLMKIGDIIDKKLNVRVYSMNIDTREIELKEIERYIENPGDEIVEILFDDSEILQCTPDHEIWTDNRGWVEAQHLTSSDILVNLDFRRKSFFPFPNSLPIYSKFFCAFNDFKRTVKKNFDIFFANKKVFSSKFNWSFYSCEFSPSISSPNLMNNDLTNIEGFANFRNWNVIYSALSDFYSNFSCQISSWSSLSYWESPVLNRVLHVVGFGAIRNIFNPIVSTISIQVTNLYSFFLGANKSPSNKSVDMNIESFTISAKSDSPVSFSRPIEKWFQYFLFNGIGLIFPFQICSLLFNNPIFRPNSSSTGNTITSLKTRNRSPLLIRKIGHADKTYCLTIKDNHNMFVGKIGLLASNCDDLHKPDEVFSQTLRESVIENFSQTLMQRLRGKNVPIIMIGQRLHESDICQYVIDGKDGYDWTKIIIRSIDDAGNIIYPEVYSKEMLLKKKEMNHYVFSSQYQQEPIPAGGALFKPDWFVLLDDEPSFLFTFVVADTAETAQTYNDATAMSFFGVYEIENFGVKTGLYGIHWIDALETHVEPKDLKQTFLSFFECCSRHKSPPKFAAIEKKSTGTSLISALSDMRGIVIKDINRSKASGSKTKRFLDAQPFVAEKRISFTRYAKHVNLCITHMSKITANDSHARDDLADVLSDAISMALSSNALINQYANTTNYDHIGARLMQKQHHIERLRAQAFNSLVRK